MSGRIKALVTAVCLVVACGVTASSAGAHNVPNEANWHIHDGLGGGPFVGDHHAGIAFWPRIFGEAYRTDATLWVRCPNVTDKVLLPHGVRGAVSTSGVCMSDRYVVHMLSGVDTPAGWSVLTFSDGSFLSYKLTSRGGG